MFGIPGPIGTILDLLVVIVGFGLIVFIHEAGHFLAARWAGIRVLAFAIGFGPAALSYRKGLGFRRGSSEGEYLRRKRERDSFTGPDPVSPTEYRLNWLPFGGYVKMLGQDDMNPAAVSMAPDSYQNCKPWKRMVVISAGVVMNLILAAALFVLVFMVGLRVEPAIVGSVYPASPAALAMPTDPQVSHQAGPGLQPGDRVVEVNGRRPSSYADLITSVAMSSRGKPVDLLVERKGFAEPLHFSIVPKKDGPEGLLSLGTASAASLTLSDVVDQLGAEYLRHVGLDGLGAGASITAAGDQTDLATLGDLDALFARSRGQPVRLTIVRPDGSRVERSVQPRVDFQVGFLPGSDTGTVAPFEHILGLAPVMRVASSPGSVTDQGKANGLEPGDVFARIAGVEYPSLAAGIRTIRAHAGREIDLGVLRQAEGQWCRVDFKAKVSNKGTLGFIPDDTRQLAAFVAMPPVTVQAAPRAEGYRPAAADLLTAPGQRIVAVEGRPVQSLIDARQALQRATADAAETGQGAEVSVTLEWPLAQEQRPRIERTWSLSSDDVRTLHGLGWSSPLDPGLFEPVQVLLKASSPGQALSTGLSETRRVLVTTYVTFARLFERTLKIENLKGPVGIAHVGTLLADRGFVWMLFFMAVISVNLAVINFLPLPIVDGGQFLMIVYEQIRGRPVPIPIQNAVTMAGFLLIASLFLIVTFNDVKNLLGL
ncbi:MAG: site-2 protease family protein [Phycisphaerales bacterium]|nr:site-2 protease family protein [Phycisphaerales bacterium]